MAIRLSLSWVLLTLVSYTLGAVEEVSISAPLDGVGHTCISKCLYYTLISDMGSAMGCGTPYDNRCYCATEAKSASAADGWMSKCASSMCKPGDYSRDLSEMQSYYGSYCVNAGFTQPGLSNWYSPAEATDAKTTDDDQQPSQTLTEAKATSDDSQPSETAESDAPETTTQRSVVTQTADSDSGAQATRSRVTVHATSTLWVDSDGSPAKLDSSDDSSSSAIKIGVGVAVPVVVLSAAAIFTWWFLRRRRQQKLAHSHPPEYVSPNDNNAQTPPPMSISPVSRKPVASPTVSSMTGGTNELPNNGVRRELSGQEIHTFTAVVPSPPVQRPGQHEMQGEGWQPEVDGQNRWTEVSGEGRPSELPSQTHTTYPSGQQASYSPYESQGHNTQRWELPGSGR